MFDWLRVGAAKTRALFSNRRLDEDFREELETHLASLTEENLHKGMSAEEASRAARLRLGGLTQLREAHRELRGLPIVETLFRDVHYALRTNCIRIPALRWWLFSPWVSESVPIPPSLVWLRAFCSNLFLCLTSIGW